MVITCVLLVGVWREFERVPLIRSEARINTFARALKDLFQKGRIVRRLPCLRFEKGHIKDPVVDRLDVVGKQLLGPTSSFVQGEKVVIDLLDGNKLRQNVTVVVWSNACGIGFVVFVVSILLRSKISKLFTVWWRVQKMDEDSGMCFGAPIQRNALFESAKYVLGPKEQTSTRIDGTVSYSANKKLR